MRFYSLVFPNLQVSVLNKEIEFKNSIYETDNDDLINALTKLGFPYEEGENIVIDGELIDDAELEELTQSAEEKVTFSIPKRWTLEQIMQFVEDNNIELPEGLEKKADIVEYIEAL